MAEVRANGGNVGKAEFAYYLQHPDGWNPSELRILGWAIEDLPQQA